MSRKKAFLQAVTFTPGELSALWRACPTSPSSPRVPDPNQLQSLFLSRRQLCATLGASDSEIQRLLRGTGRGDQQDRFDSFLEVLEEGFQKKKRAFEASWSKTMSKPVTSRAKPSPKAKTKKKVVKTTALAVREDSPHGLVDPTPTLLELDRKLGYDVFENLSALARACGVHRITLARIRDGRLVRQRTLAKIEALGRLATKTIVRRMRPAALESQ